MTRSPRPQIKTFDGLVPATTRVANFMDSAFFPAVGKHAGLPVFRGPGAVSTLVF